MTHSEYPIYMAALKKLLKLQKKNYVELATHLDISESSVKRLLNSSDGSLSRLVEICEFVGISFHDLVVSTHEEKVDYFIIDDKYEKFFLKRKAHFYLFHLLYEEKYSVKKLMDKFNLSQKSMTKYLNDLERIGLIEVHPGDKIKPLVTGAMTCREESLLGQYLLCNSMENLIQLITDPKGMFNELKGRKAHFGMGEYYVTKETSAKYTKALEELAVELERQSQLERKIHRFEELGFTTVVTGVLPARLYKDDIPNL